MTQFGNFLGEIIAAEYEGHRANFAKACELTPSAMTNFLTKGDLPTASTMGRIARCVKDPFRRAELVAAYFADLQKEADIDEVIVEVRPADKNPTEQEVQKILGTIGRRARKDPAFRRIVKDIADWPGK